MGIYAQNKKLNTLIYSSNAPILHAMLPLLFENIKSYVKSKLIKSNNFKNNVKYYTVCILYIYINIIYIALNYKFQIEIFLRKIKIINLNIINNI
jgi:uncharacterized protein (UPF0276 family)